MYITYVTFNLRGIDEKAYVESVNSLAPEYARVPGLISKVWMKRPESGVYGGVYCWASKQDFETYSKSELCALVENHPNLANFKTTAYENLPEGTSVTAEGFASSSQIGRRACSADEAVSRRLGIT